MLFRSGLDPLAHRGDEPFLWSKTGTDATVRADMGVIAAPGGAYAYAAIATWDADDDRRDEALERMHDLGTRIRSLLTAR